MDEFTEKVILIVIEKFAIALLILIVGYFVTKAIEKFKGEQAIIKDFEVMRDKTALEHLQRQIEELYSPLLGLIQQITVIYKVEQKKLPLKGNSEDYSQTRDYFVEQYYLPLNTKISELIRTKIYLLDTDEIPESFQQFLRHEMQFSSLHTLWKEKGIRSEGIKEEEYPETFEDDVNKSLHSLRNRYNYYLKRIEPEIKEDKKLNPLQNKAIE